jgi:penicillin-binding protein 2
MIISAPFRDNNPRLAVVSAMIGVGLVVLLVALWRVQVTHAEHYDNREQAQSLRRIRIPSARGEIVDRNGVVLANNRPSYDIVMYLEQLNRESKKQDIVKVAAASVAALSQTLQIPVSLAERDVRTHYQLRRPLPLPVWRDVSPEMVAGFSERGSTLPGVDLIVTPVRQYPLDKLAAHVLGYVGKAEQNPDEELEKFYYYQPDTVGRQGVERGYDEFLRGAPGGRTIRVSPGGTMVGEVGEKPAERGNRVVLTLDANMQRIVEDALAHAPLTAGKELRGAAVVLDPRTGEVLAMASVPAFDPNIFRPGVPAQTVQAVLTNPQSPMLNRAIGARYAPGSTFKPVTLLAGLESKTISMDDTVVCSGSLQIGNWPRPFGCWNRSGHGRVDALLAIKQSCDVWFYQRGMATGVDAIGATARQLGLGQPTTIDLGKDVAGLVPSAGWKRGTRGERWWDGDTAQMSIGQSFLLVTPLQMAGLAATLANGGTHWRPFVVKRVESPTGELLRDSKPAVLSQLSASARNIQTVRQTLLAAVQAGDGTAHRATVQGLSVAGKTGTAEFDTAHGRIKRAWFIGFAPFEKPEVAMAVVLEDAESGGHTAAPVAARIFAGIFGKEAAPVTGGGGD